MKIRHMDGPLEGQDTQDTFVAYDDLGGMLGGADVTSVMRDMLCPSRPHQLLIRTECEQGALDALLGAATARAMYLAREKQDSPARIFCECNPSDEERMRVLQTQGYMDDDGLVRMKKMLKRGPIIKPLPRDCVIVRDYLIDDSESKYFVERYNAMFASDKDMDWLNELKQRPNFARLLMVAPDGLAGELVTWSDAYSGVVGVIQTPPHWQQKGVASHLMEQARNYWLDKGLVDAYFDVWTRLTGAMRLAATTGFRPEEMLLRYPGIDMF
ncbi:hypothetical protein LJC33_05955 [Eubacteriales bacterium OttesenSCG-928-N13]|nr:hypothetical protein [Eubacteriales bacterium OttesenSCG-928-N13]